MKKIVIVSGLIFLLAGIDSLADAQLDLEKSTVLSRHDFVEQALTKDPEFTIALQQYLQTKYSSLSAREVADWTLSASAIVDHTEVTAGSTSVTNADSLGYEFGLEKLFLTTGTRASLTHSTTLTDSDSTVAGTTQSSTPVITLSVTQPLLKNALGLADRYPVILADLQKQSAYNDAVEAWEGRILELEHAYLSWSDAYETVRAYQAIVSEQKKLEDQVRRKYQSRVSNKKDLVQAEESLLQYQSLLIQAETSYLNECANIVYLQTGEIVGDEALAIRPEKTAEIDIAIQPMGADQVKALRLVKKIDYLLEQQRHQMAVAKNALLPSLNLVGEVSTKGEEEKLNGGYSTLGENQDYSLLLQASMPLGRYAAKGDVGVAEAGLAEIEASLQSTQRSMLLSVQQTVRQLEMMAQTNAIQEKLVEKGKVKLELDQKDYAIGRLDIYYLIDTQNSLSAARLDFIQSSIQLEKNKLSYLAIIDKLASRYPVLMEKLKP